MDRLIPRIGYILAVCLLFLGHAAGTFHIEASTALPSIHATWPAFNELVFTPEFLLLATLGLLLSISLPQLDPIPASLLTVACTFPPIYLNHAGMLNTSILPMEYYLLVILMLFVINVLISYYAYSRQRQQIIDTFSHYVPAEMVNRLCREPDSFSLEGESRELTVLFADLVNFTTIAECLDPKDLTKLINRHFELMTNILLDHGATIDKYIGDSVMAFWGAPLAMDDHSERAVAAAFAMQDAISTIDREVVDEVGQELQLCIGLNRGIMNVGNIGSYKRANYTVIGDAVNVASRLERLTREYQVPIIVSDSVVLATPGYVYRQLDRINIRGKQQEVDIYQPLHSKSATTDNLDNSIHEKHIQAIRLYLDHQYQQAHHEFIELSKNCPDDSYYQVMLDKTTVRLNYI